MINLNLIIFICNYAVERTNAFNSCFNLDFRERKSPTILVTKLEGFEKGKIETFVFFLFMHSVPRNPLCS